MNIFGPKHSELNSLENEGKRLDKVLARFLTEQLMITAFLALN